MYGSPSRFRHESIQLAVLVLAGVYTQYESMLGGVFVLCSYRLNRHAIVKNTRLANKCIGCGFENSLACERVDVTDGWMDGQKDTATKVDGNVIVCV